jgi:hypothetical protein
MAAAACWMPTIAGSEARGATRLNASVPMVTPAQQQDAARILADQHDMVPHHEGGTEEAQSEAQDLPAGHRLTQQRDRDGGHQQRVEAGDDGGEAGGHGAHGEPGEALITSLIEQPQQCQRQPRDRGLLGAAQLTAPGRPCQQHQGGAEKAQAEEQQRRRGRDRQLGGGKG